MENHTQKPDQVVLLTVEALADYLQCHPNQVYKMIREGCPCLKVGRSYRFDVTAVVVWLKATTPETKTA